MKRIHNRYVERMRARDLSSKLSSSCGKNANGTINLKANKWYLYNNNFKSIKIMYRIIYRIKYDYLYI